MDFNDALARVSEAHHYMDTLRVHPDSPKSAAAKREILVHLSLARQKLATAQLHHLAGDYVAAAKLLGYHPINTTVYSHLSDANFRAREIREHPDAPKSTAGFPEHVELLFPVQYFSADYEHEHDVPETFSEEDEIKATHKEAERQSLRHYEPPKSRTPEESREYQDNARNVIDEIANNSNIVFGGQSRSINDPPKEPGFY
jgi:hypothetical protein